VRGSVSIEIPDALGTFPVMLAAIDFHDQPISDYKIDAADPINFNLRLHLDTKPRHPISEQRFGAGSGIGSSPSQEQSSARHFGGKPLNVRHAKGPIRQKRFEDGESEVRWLAVQHLDQALSNRQSARSE
jgi:hypothetical protein